MLIFTIGHKVKIKSKDWFNCSKDIRTGWIKRQGQCFTESMANKLCGNIFEVTNIIDDKFYVLSDGSVIFEYAIDLEYSTKINNINIESIPSVDQNEESKLTEIPRRAGRPKGSKTKLTNEKSKVKISKGELVIYWTKASKIDFGLATYYGVENKLIKVSIDGNIINALGVIPYSKDEFDNLTKLAVHHFRNIHKELDELNNLIANQIKEFENKYGVILTAMNKLTLVH